MGGMGYSPEDATCVIIIVGCAKDAPTQKGYPVMSNYDQFNDLFTRAATSSKREGKYLSQLDAATQDRLSEFVVWLEGEGISPLGLFLGALPPTVVAIVFFSLLH